MNVLIIASILILSLLALGFTTYFSIKRKVQNYTQNIFGTTSLKGIVEQAKLNEENTPKTITGMEPLNLPYLIRDFPNIEINEFKKMAENIIFQYFKSIETKNIEKINNSSEKVNNYIQSKINDTLNDNISYNSIKIHKTILNKYTKSIGKCNVIFHTSLEYILKNNNEEKKIQSRFKTEYIYIIDDKNINNNLSGIALNCPNCGAPIKNLGQKKCVYCDTGVIDLVKRTWILNDIQEF